VKLRLNHVGLVVSNISKFAELFRALGLDDMTEPQPDPIQMVTASFITAEPNKEVHIELLEPTSENSPIAGFLQKKGEGLHHLCFEVESIDEISKSLLEKGFQMVSPPVKCVGYDSSFWDDGTRETKISFFAWKNTD